MDFLAKAGATAKAAVAKVESIDTHGLESSILATAAATAAKVSKSIGGASGTRSEHGAAATPQKPKPSLDNLSREQLLVLVRREAESAKKLRAEVQGGAEVRKAILELGLLPLAPDEAV